MWNWWNHSEIVPLTTSKALPTLHSWVALDLLGQFTSPLDQTMSLQHPSLDQAACCPQGEKPNSLYFLLEPFLVLCTVTSGLQSLGESFAKLYLLDLE